MLSDSSPSRRTVVPALIVAGLLLSALSGAAQEPRDTIPARDTLPVRDTVPARDTLPIRDTLPVRDTLPAAPSGPVVPLVTLGSSLEDQARTAQLRGEQPTDGYLLRSPSTLTPRLRGGEGGARWAVIAPEMTLVWNSALPNSQNDGPLWAGKGANASVLVGARVEYGLLFLVLAPQVGFSQNRDFSDLLPDSMRQSFTLPWYRGAHSVDLPFRFGRGTVRFVDPGQSTLGVRAGGAVLGVSTENQWWGPGIRNAIVLSNQAAGIPHLFVRTGPPLRTGIGSFEAKWILGALSESAFFDTVTADDRRAFSAMVLTFSPGWDPRLTLGAARSVQAPVSGTGAAFSHAFDVLYRGAGSDSVHAGSDQLLSLFGRWVFPADGLEVYAEWARQELPTGLGDFLDYPTHSQGYTFGAQWARPLADRGRLLRLQTEFTYLEQSSTFRYRAVPWYSIGASTRQGYTQRGQMIGAAIGPGSSQWLAADYLASGWRVGAFLGRIRWDNDAFYTTERVLHPRTGPWQAHDVSVFGGIRAGRQLPMARLDAELSRGTRLNYLNQNFGIGWEHADEAVDVRNYTLRLVVTPYRATAGSAAGGR